MVGLSLKTRAVFDAPSRHHMTGLLVSPNGHVAAKVLALAVAMKAVS
jgi:hypothetical protein